MPAMFLPETGPPSRNPMAKYIALLVVGVAAVVSAACAAFQALFQN